MWAPTGGISLLVMEGLTTRREAPLPSDVRNGVGGPLCISHTGLFPVARSLQRDVPSLFSHQC